MKYLLRGELLLHLIDLLLLGGGGLIPAFGGHLLVDLILHAERIVQRGGEGLVHAGGAGFDRAVHIQVAHALGGEEKVLHNGLVVHGCASLNKLIEPGEQLLMLLHHLLNEVLEIGVGQTVHGLLALRAQNLLVTEGVLNVKKLLGTHDYHLRG